MSRICAAVAVVASGFATASHAETTPDLRNITVGMPIAQLSMDGYVDIACAPGAGGALSAFTAYATCSKDSSGAHEVRFKYADDPKLSAYSENGEGTKVAGQPMVLTLLIDDAGIVQGLRMQTDPKVRLFIKRRAHIFGLQAMMRYGDDGWHCVDAKPSAHEQPIGDSFINQHCEKTTADRHYIVDRALYHDPERPLTDFVSSAEVEVFKR